MGFDVLILNSGEWVLSEELPAEPWHILIYRQRGEPRNELHIWLPRQGGRGSADYAFRRYWVEGRTRWCLELPREKGSHPKRGGKGGDALRFTSPDGLVLWSRLDAPRRLGDYTNRELQRLREQATTGGFSLI